MTVRDKAGVAIFVLASAFALWLVASGENSASEVKQRNVHVFEQPGTGKTGEVFESWAEAMALKGTAAATAEDEFVLECLFEPPGDMSGEDTWLLGTNMSVRRPFNFGLGWQEPINGKLFSMSREEVERYYYRKIQPETTGLKLPGGWTMSFAPGERLKDTLTRLLQDPCFDTLRRNADDIVGGVAEGLKLELKIAF